MASRLLPGGGVIEFETEWLPGSDPDSAAGALYRLSEFLDDTEMPLGESGIILENDIRDRFDTETDPGGIPWVDLNETWAERKQDDPRFLPVGDSPSGDYILRLTGDLYQAATDPSAFVIGEDELLYDPTDLPVYAMRHQFGDQKIPQRSFIGISESAQDDIEATFIAWVDLGIEETWTYEKFGTPYVHPTGTVQARIPKGQPGAGGFAKKIL